MNRINLEWFFVLLSPIYFFVFRGIYIAFQIQSGRYRSKKLDEFPLYFTDELEYESIVDRIKEFIQNIIYGNDCYLSLSDKDINCLVYKGITPVKPFQLLEKIGLVFYYIEDSRLFRKSMEYQGPGLSSVNSYLQEISFAKKCFNDSRDTDNKSKRILVGTLPVYEGRSYNNLEESIDRGYHNNMPLCFIYRDRFIRGLFNSDLDFPEEDIEKSLEKITSVEIINAQLIFVLKTN